MRRPPKQANRVRWLAGLVALGLTYGPATAQTARAPQPAKGADSAWTAMLHQKIPLDEMSPPMRERVRKVLDHPLLTTRGPVEVFRGRSDLYHWYVEHPDRGVSAWRRMGAKCCDIHDLGQGRFAWSDGQGSSVQWETVYRGPHLRVWYAEGKGRPGPLLPTVTASAVAVLHQWEGRDSLGRTLIHHQIDLYLHTDSKTMTLVTELLGPSAQHIARQCVAQMELFFSGPIWYLDHHPEYADYLFSTAKLSRSPL
jgi:hypothetical protein